jgi:hypothetical protein
MEDMLGVVKPPVDTLGGLGVGAVAAWEPIGRASAAYPSNPSMALSASAIRHPLLDVLMSQ